MAGFAELTKDFHKEYGDKIGGQGYEHDEVPRIRTGILALDIMLGGGIPRGAFTEVFGPESSCKSMVASLTMAQHQRLLPDLDNAWFDVENSYEDLWEKSKGVDVDKVYLFKPQFAEEVVDMCHKLFQAEKCGLVVVDSLAAMVTNREDEQSADKDDVGGHAKVVKKLCKKVVKAQSDMRNEGRYPTFLCINQISMKIGVMFGSPETTPGGNAKNFMASMRLRLYGADVKDPKFNKDHAVRKKVTVVLKKSKVRVVARECEFEIVVVPHNGKPIGFVDNWPVLYSYMYRNGLVAEEAVKGKKTWVYQGTVYQTLTSLKDDIMGNQEEYDALTAMIIQMELDKVYAELDNKDG